MGTPNASAIFATTWTLGFLTESLSIIGDPKYGRVEACTFGQLIHTAEHRLFRLRDNMKSRYENIPALDLVNQVLSEPIQMPMDAPIK